MVFFGDQDMRRVCDYEHSIGPVVLDPSMVVHSGLYFSTSQPHTASPSYAAIYDMKSHLVTRLMEIHLGRELMIQVIYCALMPSTLIKEISLVFSFVAV